MKYEVVRTETADAQIRKIVLYIAENFGNKVALEKLEELEQNILDYVTFYPIVHHGLRFLFFQEYLVQLILPFRSFLTFINITTYTTYPFCHN